MPTFIINIPRENADLAQFFDDVSSIMREAGNAVELVDQGMPICGLARSRFESGSVEEYLQLGYYAGVARCSL